jgi:isohexenylglutaconyl-CoA hydratase
MATARRLMLTGARFKGIEAKAMGLADYVAADIAGLDEIEAAVRKSVLRCAPGANGRTKDILRQIGELPMEALMDFAADRFADCMLDEEGREGIASFTEKRKPVWAEQSA